MPLQSDCKAGLRWISIRLVQQEYWQAGCTEGNQQPACPVFFPPDHCRWLQSPAVINVFRWWGRLPMLPASRTQQCCGRNSTIIIDCVDGKIGQFPFLHPVVEGRKIALYMACLSKTWPTVKLTCSVCRAQSKLWKQNSTQVEQRCICTEEELTLEPLSCRMCSLQSGCIL